MAVTIDGTTGVSLVQDGVVTAADLSSTLDLTGKTVTLPAGTGGKVLQVVEARSTATGSISSSSWTEYMSTSITPSSTTSKILVQFAAPLGYQDNKGGSSFYYNQTIYRDSTNIGEGSGLTGTYQHSVSYNDFPLNNGGMMILDSPSTTSSVTYKVMHKEGGNGAVCVMRLEGRAHLILMEISG